MIEHMASETKSVFKITTHKNYCLFYHEALSLMESKETHKCMKEKGYKSMWILPKMDIFASNPILKCYIGRTFGNSPELCNIDSCKKNCTSQWIFMLGVHIHCIHFIQFLLLFKRQIKEHQLNLGSLIQLTVSLHQGNGSYPTRMTYSPQLSILWRQKSALS